MVIPSSILRRFIERALEEDLGRGDVTTQTLFPNPINVEAHVTAHSTSVMAGGPIALLVFQTLDPSISGRIDVQEGSPIPKDTKLFSLQGDARMILSGERVALNILQRLCGIATLTQAFVHAVEGFKAQILDTRKTPPGWRLLDKYAVYCGGGGNHRMGLDDGMMIKDNHLSLLGMSEAVKRAKKNLPPLLKVEVEVESLPQAQEAVQAGADMILLDNISCEEMAKIVAWVQGRVLLEASGGINLKNVREVAATGIDFISVGLLTHSPAAADIGLKILRKD